MAKLAATTFRFSGLYYPEILQDLTVHGRINTPEITDEDPHEPFVQFRRETAYALHNANVLLDHIALEALLPTARLRETVRGQLALIGYRLAQPSPAVAELVAKLSSPLSGATTFARGARYAVPGTKTTAEIRFEQSADLVASASRYPTKVLEDDAGVVTDRTSAATTPGALWVPWGAGPVSGDALYVGHDSVEWVKTSFVLGGLGLTGSPDFVIEYYDGGVDDCAPDAVAVAGGGLVVDLTTLLGPLHRHGATVRVRCVATGVYEDVVSTWNGGTSTNEATTSTFLGQAIASVAPGDYVVGAPWKEFEGLVTEISADHLTVSLETPLPESTSRQWQKTTVAATIDAYWWRLRWLATFGSALTFDTIEIDDGEQFVKFEAIQGESVTDNPAGSSSGDSDQVILTSREDVIDGSLVVYVDEGSGWVAWGSVDDFLSSTSTSRHAVVDYDESGRAIVMFGDGAHGMIPPTGTDNYRLDYRVGASADGNVGAGEISRNLSGSSRVRSVTNPRAAVGWQPAEGGTDADLARVKIAGPATLRTMGRALTADDCEALAVAYKTANGSRPALRANSIEEAFGVKTIGLYLVGAGGGALTVDQLDEFDLYFNGDPIENLSGVLVLNSELTSANYSPKTIDVVITTKGGTQAVVEQAIAAYLSPVAKVASGPNVGAWLHEFDSAVYLSKIDAIVHDADPDVRGVVALTLNGAALDVTYGPTELPTLGTLAVIVT